MPEYLDRIFRHSRLSLSTHSCLFLSSYRSILLHAFLLFNQLHVLLRFCKEILHQSILFKRQGSSSHDVLNLRSHHRIGQCAAHHHEYTGTQHILKVIYNELPDVVVHLLNNNFSSSTSIFGFCLTSNFITCDSTLGLGIKDSFGTSIIGVAFA